MPEKQKSVDIALIDDEPDLIESCARILEGEGYNCVTTTDSRTAIELIRKAEPKVVISDYKMPGKDGVKILEEVREEFPAVPVIMISAFATVERVVEAVKSGAFDYLTKPFSSDQLTITVNRAMERQRLHMENVALKTRLRDDYFSRYFVGKSPAVLAITDLVKKVAQTDSPALITGETGTGKELLARAIHQLSKRSEKAFLAVDSRSLTGKTLEAAEEGNEERSGRDSVFPAANGGTLYLEKAEELDMETQARLIRILQEKKTPKQDGWDSVPVDVRVLASTTGDLHSAMLEKKIRENLYYSLNVFTIQIPPLRERKEDIGILADYFLKLLAEENGASPKTVHHEALAVMIEYDWPGNARELKSVMEMSASISDDTTIMVRDLPENIRQSDDMKGLSFKNAKKKWMEQFEKNYLENLLLSQKGNIVHAAEEAGIARMSLYRMLKRNNLTGLAAHERESGKKTDINERNENK